MGKGSQTQKTTQENNPPAWAAPLFKQAAGDAQNLYNSKSGYNVYTGPTQANFSPQRLEGLNRAMTMTGSRSPAITNDSIYNTDQIQQIRGMIKQQQDARAAQAAAAAQAPPQQQAPQRNRIWVENGNSWGPRGGQWVDGPPDYYAGRTVRR
jgi:hypothetical protein